MAHSKSELSLANDTGVTILGSINCHAPCASIAMPLRLQPQQEPSNCSPSNSFVKPRGLELLSRTMKVDKHSFITASQWQLTQ